MDERHEANSITIHFKSIDHCLLKNKPKKINSVHSSCNKNSDYWQVASANRIFSLELEMITMIKVTAERQPYLTFTQINTPSLLQQSKSSCRHSTFHSEHHLQNLLYFCIFVYPSGERTGNVIPLPKTNSFHHSHN